MSSAQIPMDDADVAILIVDDAKFTCEMLRRGLTAAGYRDVRVAHTAKESLAMMRERKAQILLADWLMPEMDGLSLTERVRQIDEETNHYTYVVLLTAKEGAESLTEAFDHGVDDFINKSHDNTELLARIRGAGRISVLQNHLLSANQRLLDMSRERERADWFDTVTGLPNRAFLDQQIDRLLRHIEARGGGGCLALARINQLEALRTDHGQTIANQVVTAFGSRLQQCVRPLDWVTRVDDSHFALLMHQGDSGACHPNAFRRIHQALNLRAYKTDNGFLNVSAAVSLLALPNRRGAAATEPCWPAVPRAWTPPRPAPACTWWRRCPRGSSDRESPRGRGSLTASGQHAVEARVGAAPGRDSSLSDSRPGAAPTFPGHYVAPLRGAHQP